jgi:putative membrane protein
MSKKVEKSKKKAILKVAVLIGVLLLPLVYSLTYLKGFWNPYNNLGNMQVAVVNKDKCLKNCQSADLISKLKKSDSFDFVETNATEAERGLHNKKYYATVTIPADFSDSFRKVESKQRHGVVLRYRPNNKTNYIAAQLINNAMMRVELNLNKNVAEKIVGTLSEKLEAVPEQMHPLAEGLGTIADGGFRLEDGLGQAISGNKQLFEGIGYLKNQVELKADFLANDNTSALDQATINQIAERASSGAKLSDAQINQIRDASSTQAMQAVQVKEPVIRQIAENKIENDNNIPPMLKTMARKIAGDTAVATAQMMAGQTAELVAPEVAKQVAIIIADQTARVLAPQVANQVKTKAKTQTVSSLYELGAGLKKLQDGSGQLDNGLNSLQTGTHQLGVGALAAQNQLNEKIQNNQKKLESLQGLDKYAKEPVKIKNDGYGKVDDYGSFFSPFFMSLSLWLGGLLIMMGLYYDPDNRFEILGRNSKRPLLRAGIYGLIGVLQSVVLGVVLHLTLGFKPTNLALYYGSCVFIGLSFLAIMMLLFFHLGDLGKFIAMVWLVIQLATCAGTFPIETEPSLFQNVSPFMPMTYSVELLRESFVSIEPHLLIKNIVVLAVILVGSLSLTAILGLIKHHKTGKIMVK